jgi:hypothetical protein
VFELDFGAAFKVTCVKCDAERELPDIDGGGRLPAASPDGSTTLEADGVCRCGASRIRVRLDFGDGEKATNQVPSKKRPSKR